MHTSLRHGKRLTLATLVTGSVLAATLTAVAATTASAAEGCEVDYKVVNNWGSGFAVDVSITAGDAINGWDVEWTFPGSTQVQSAWNVDWDQSGSAFTGSDVGWNGAISSGQSRQVFGFVASGSAQAPADISVNGVACDGSGGGDPTDEPTDEPTDDPTGGPGDPPGGLEGWATQNGGTTGGAGGSETTVSSASAFESAVDGDSAKIVRVSGTLNLSDMVTVGSNTTIVGDSGATITGGGLHFDGAHNVIVTNMRFDDWDDDAINVQDASTNLWFDHNTFGKGYDGALDIKRESDFITVSWNRFNGTDKNMLLGHDDGHTADDGNLRVSYHHNYFNDTVQRNPRVRFGETVHVYNNYYYSVSSYGVATTMDAGVLFEGNYLEDTEVPTEVGYADSDPGRIVSRNNHLVDSGTPDNSGSVDPVPYGYTLDNAQDVKSIVTGGAGAS
jgi:pectate lyase